MCFSPLCQDEGSWNVEQQREEEGGATPLVNFVMILSAIFYGNLIHALLMQQTEYKVFIFQFKIFFKILKNCLLNSKSAEPTSRVIVRPQNATESNLLEQRSCFWGSSCYICHPQAPGERECLEELQAGLPWPSGPCFAGAGRGLWGLLERQLHVGTSLPRSPFLRLPLHLPWMSP